MTLIAHGSTRLCSKLKHAMFKYNCAFFVVVKSKNAEILLSNLLQNYYKYVIVFLCLIYTFDENINCDPKMRNNFGAIAIWDFYVSIDTYKVIALPLFLV